MSRYQFRYRTSQGFVKRGTLQAPDYAHAVAQARSLGGAVLEVKEVKEGGGLHLSFLKPRGISLKDRIVLTEQVSVMLGAGITLVQALRGLQEEAGRSALAKLLQSLADDVEAGLPFSEALEKHPRSFSMVYCHMVRSAEQSGNLAEVLLRLTSQQQKEYELRGKIRGALMYPVIVMILLVAVLILVITFVIPRLSGVFAQSGTALPWSTQFLLKLAAFFTNQWYLALGGLVALIVGFRLVLSTKTGTWWFDTIKLKFPVLGTFSRKAAMARFAQTFCFLNQAGVPILETFRVTQGVMNNVVLEREVDHIRKDVENGIPISTAIRKSPYFPAMVGQLVKVGEESGDLGEMLRILGDFFEKEVDGMARNLSTLLEPLIMIVMGAGIGFVLISVLQPIYGLINAIN